MTDNGSVCLKLGTITLSLLTLAGVALAWQQKRPRTVSPAGIARTLTIFTEPSAIVWIDEIRRGMTDSGGKLTQVKVASGAHTLRVRANGFKELTMPLTAALCDMLTGIPSRLT